MERKQFKDGEYDFKQVKDAMNDDFVSEKDLCKYIEENIVDFCNDCLNIKYKSHEKEVSIVGVDKKVKGNRRIDFVIVSESGERIGIEVKRPFYNSELTLACGQCLGYLALFEQHGRPLSRIIIVSSKIDSVLPMIINRFNLPIGFICFDKDKFLTYMRTEIRNGRK